MGSVLVVVPAPILQLFPGIFKAHEPVSVQTFRPQLAVERFDKRIVRGFSWATEIECDAVGVGPKIQIARDELRSLVDTDGAGIANLGTDPFQRLDDILSPIAELRINGGRELREYIDHRQNPDLIYLAPIGHVQIPSPKSRLVDTPPCGHLPAKRRDRYGASLLYALDDLRRRRKQRKIPHARQLHSAAGFHPWTSEAQIDQISRSWRQKLNLPPVPRPYLRPEKSL